MNLYILRDGKKIGPFSDEAARTLLAQGDVGKQALACRSGATDWQRLSDLLGAPTSAGGPPPAVEADGPATAEQLAFLRHFGADAPAGLRQQEAAALAREVVEGPHAGERLAQWEAERARRHPELLAEDVRSRKESRVQLFFDLCHTAGADYFSGVTKAHCQVLVAFLDVKFPRWDANSADATERYFFPALAEQFPQLVNKAWRSRLRTGEGPAAALAKAARREKTRQLARRTTSPLAAIARGLLLGLAILVAIYLAHRFWPQGPVSRQSPQVLPTAGLASISFRD